MSFAWTISCCSGSVPSALYRALGQPCSASRTLYSRYLEGWDPERKKQIPAVLSSASGRHLSPQLRLESRAALQAKPRDIILQTQKSATRESLKPWTCCYEKKIAARPRPSSTHLCQCEPCIPATTKVSTAGIAKPGNREKQCAGFRSRFDMAGHLLMVCAQRSASLRWSGSTQAQM